MSKKNDNRLAIALGLIAGGVAGWWLNSEKGRKVRAAAAEKANEVGTQVVEKATVVGNQVTEKAQDQISNLSTSVKQVANKGQRLAAQASESIKSTISNVANNANDTVDTTENAFVDGTEEAKRKVERLENALNA